jgi:hypothetical protein
MNEQNDDLPVSKKNIPLVGRMGTSVVTMDNGLYSPSRKLNFYEKDLCDIETDDFIIQKIIGNPLPHE